MSYRHCKEAQLRRPARLRCMRDAADKAESAAVAPLVAKFAAEIDDTAYLVAAVEKLLIAAYRLGRDSG